MLNKIQETLVCTDPFQVNAKHKSLNHPLQRLQPPIENWCMMGCSHKRSKGQPLPFINVCYFYFPSFLPMRLIVHDEFKSQLWIIPFMNWLSMIPKAWGRVLVAFSHPQTAWHTYSLHKARRSAADPRLVITSEILRDLNRLDLSDRCCSKLELLCFSFTESPSKLQATSKVLRNELLFPLLQF